MNGDVLLKAADLIESTGQIAVGEFRSGDSEYETECYCALGAIGEVWQDEPEFMEPTLWNEEEAASRPEGWRHYRQDHEDEVREVLVVLAGLIAENDQVDPGQRDRWESSEDNPAHVVTAFNDTHTVFDVVNLLRAGAERLEG